jgi:peptidoglycan/xylan/chitin deacetylase (PgdA/CDA1 family)
MIRQGLKYCFYNFFCPLLLFLGVDKFLRNGSVNRRLIIMYHGVTKGKNFAINGRHLPSAAFEKQLQYYKKNFDVVPLERLCNGGGDKKGKRSIALTFDDGYLNNMECAIPLLLKYQLPATFFVSTAGLDKQDYVHPADYIDMIRCCTAHSVDINGIVFYHTKNQLINSERITAHEYLNSLSFVEFKAVINTLKNIYSIQTVTRNIDPEVYSLVNAEAIKRIVENQLISIGSHSHDHVNLTKLSCDECDDQLGRSKKILEDCTGKPVHTVAFPYGFFNKEVVHSASKHGYRYQIAGGSIESDDRNFVFARIGILNMAGYAFNMLSVNRGFERFGF